MQLNNLRSNSNIYEINTVDIFIIIFIKHKKFDIQQKYKEKFLGTQSNCTETVYRLQSIAVHSFISYKN